jgi:hypothetical protein
MTDEEWEIEDQIEEEGPLYQCSKCPGTFSSKETLQQHGKEAHLKTCPQPDFLAPFASRLVAHKYKRVPDCKVSFLLRCCLRAQLVSVIDTAPSGRITARVKVGTNDQGLDLYKPMVFETEDDVRAIMNDTARADEFARASNVPFLPVSPLPIPRSGACHGCGSFNHHVAACPLARPDHYRDAKKPRRGRGRGQPRGGRGGR